MTGNSDKIILDLCGGTSAWSRPYKEAGYDVRLITLPDYDITKTSLGTAYVTFRSGFDDEGMVINCKDIYGILAAPPCTEFSLAKNGSHQHRDFTEGLKTVEACETIIRHCRLHGKPKFWAMENPVGYLRQFIGKPTYTFYQWWFGDLGIKRTDLWGYYNEPKRTVFERPNHPYFIKQYKSGKKESICLGGTESTELVRGRAIGQSCTKGDNARGVRRSVL